MNQHHQTVGQVGHENVASRMAPDVKEKCEAQKMRRKASTIHRILEQIKGYPVQNH